MSTPQLLMLASVLAAAGVVVMGVWSTKPPEFWVALVAGALIVIERHKEKPVVSRMLIAAASAGIGYSLAPDFAAWSGRSEVIAVMLLTAFGYLTMDIGAAIISDTAFWKRIVQRRIGKD